MSKEEALNTARRLVQEAVDVANRAGIDPSDVVAPHCDETAATRADGDERGSGNLTWSGVPGVIDDSTEGLFEMPEPDDDPEQKPAFLVTQSTADLVQQDFERYQPSLERMAEDWQEDKKYRLSGKKADKKEPVMKEDIKQNVDTNSTEFNEGVEAGLNSEQDTKNWKAGDELGQELKDKGETKEPVSDIPVNEASTPLFVMDSPEGNQGNAQDEKDAIGE